MRYYILIICFLCACNSETKYKSVNSKNSWEYQSKNQSFLMEGNNCTISLIASPATHELSYVISYEGKGYLQPLQIVTIEGRPAAVLISEKKWIEEDTVIQGRIKPKSNLLQYVKVNEYGPLRRHYHINLEGDGKMQHLTFRLDEKQYQFYESKYPYTTKATSYLLSNQNIQLEPSINKYMNELLESKSGCKGVQFSETEMNVAGVICKVKCIYDGEKLDLELKWMNHSEFDLWLNKPLGKLKLEHELVNVEWEGVQEKKGFRKGQRAIFKMNIPIKKAPSSISLPIEYITFYDGQLFFYDGFELQLEVRRGV